MGFPFLFGYYFGDGYYYSVVNITEHTVIVIQLFFLQKNESTTRSLAISSFFSISSFGAIHILCYGIFP